MIRQAGRQFCRQAWRRRHRALTQQFEYTASGALQQERLDRHTLYHKQRYNDRGECDMRVSTVPFLPIPPTRPGAIVN